MNKYNFAVGVVAVFALVVAAGCRSSTDLADAYGNFESDDIVISAETAGRLQRFSVTEGDNLAPGYNVGLVDTVQLALQRDQILAQKAAVRARMPGIAAQIGVLEEQRRVAQQEKKRVMNLLESGAGTRKQVDDVDGQLAVLERQIASIRTQNAPLFAELSVLDAQLAQLEDRIRRSIVINPVGGTVLVKYAEAHELTSPGKPLYKLAKLDTLSLRAYLSGAQLTSVAIGDSVSVVVDRDEDSGMRLRGVITWISSEAEFTPKLIQTKEERVNLVYAFKVRVANPDGVVKLGMPGEVWFSEPNGG